MEEEEFSLIGLHSVILRSLLCILSRDQDRSAPLPPLHTGHHKGEGRHLVREFQVSPEHLQ